ncbi:SGNH/GDSL hydrolase family protein [Pseudobacteriovorax antillogorgiicola]|uniref:Phospholipase/lecithinase/hemolysin n=1 Tax=Pseudobacteriovorax antillogorgiicola TaxID=1513793 RepID=A0A1Y6CLF5_9BACT|nr:SGNH/GDSL hydrolase family protein [Pseudobacteriovorax antillogorgiicola]TCS45433.1 phospholipase/lecithinase/hemolysin [Pseudobacteriovorax antillogorgiicola]SMF74438.1 Phospholipase/lecithinase/hemolysin [Pseudobacteriovorax antillogorgiicola]
MIRQMCTILLSVVLVCQIAGASQRVESMVFEGQELLLTPFPDPNIASRYTSIFVFGDSLSDEGNLNRRTFGIWAPGSVYYKNRFSNGPIWIDYVKSALNAKSHNFAVGSAETGVKTGIRSWIIPSTEQQIRQAKSRLEKVDVNRSLAVLWVGSFNYRNFNNDRPQKVVDQISEQIQTILELGFRTVMIGTIPSLEQGPGLSHKEPRPDATMKSLVVKHNGQLRQVVRDFAKENPRLKIGVFEAFALNQATQKKPGYFGFSNTEEPCYDGDPTGSFYGNQKDFCNDPSGYKYWDYLHPNSKMHCYYASQFLLDLSTLHDLDFLFEESLHSCMSL